ncbi:MAG: ABC transporter substrate-binding protein [Spirochaetaceae bacterium]|nr:ABC transporter substrate-binding protein [Spirochaetaceae bacterium]
MKKCKKILLILLCFVACGMLLSCVEKEAKPKSISIAALKGPSSVGMAYLFEKNEEVNKVPVHYEVVASPDIALPRLLKGELDAGILPINAAAKVFNSTDGQIQLAAIVGNGMLKLVTSDEKLTDLSQLKGKTLYVAGQGSTPEYLIRYLLDKEGIPVEKTNEGVELAFNLAPAELAPALIAGKIDYAFLPEPFATVALMNKKPLFAKIDIQSLYKKYSGFDNYPMTAFVVRTDFARKYPSVLETLLKQYEDSIIFANESPLETGVLVEKHGLGLKSPIVAKSIPNSNFVFNSAESTKDSTMAFLNLLLNFAPQSIGGKLPTDIFYYSTTK